MDLKPYQSHRKEFLINTEWGTDKDAVSKEDAENRGLVLFKDRWVAKEEQTRLKDEYHAYHSIRIIAKLLTDGTVFRTPVRAFSDGSMQYSEVRIMGKQLLLGDAVEGECRYRDFGGCFYLHPEIVNLNGYDMQTSPDRACGGPNDPLSPAYLTLSKDDRTITLRFCDKLKRLERN